MYMHLRTDSGPSKYGIIGWKPVTRCQTPPSEIIYENRFYRQLLGGWYPQADEAKGKAQLVTNYTQKNVKFYCKNKKETVWKGLTFATVKATNGKEYIAQHFTQEYKVNCGA